MMTIASAPMAKSIPELRDIYKGRAHAHKLHSTTATTAQPFSTGRNYWVMGAEHVTQTHKPFTFFIWALIGFLFGVKPRQHCIQTDCRGRWGELGCESHAVAAKAIWAQDARSIVAAYKRGALTDDAIVALQHVRRRPDVVDALSVEASR